MSILVLGIASYMPDPRQDFPGWYGLFTALPAYVIAAIVLVPILRNRAKGQLQQVALAIVGFLYFGWMFSHLGFLANATYAYGYILYLVFAVEINDVAAFTCGKLFGKHKLRENISPNKTIEGSIGAVLISMGLPFLLWFSFPHFEPWQLVLTGLIVGIGGQLGDLVISFIKRDIGIKDMGAPPDIVVVIDTNKEAIAVQEANKLSIPVVAVVDSNSNPAGINHPVPGNDDSLRAIELYCELISAAVLDGLQEEARSTGVDIGESEEAPTEDLGLEAAAAAEETQAAKPEAPADAAKIEAPVEAAKTEAPAVKPRKKDPTIGVVIIKNVAGKTVTQIPAAIVADGWIALPRQVSLGGSQWLFQTAAGQKLSIIEGIVAENDRLGISQGVGRPGNEATIISRRLRWCLTVERVVGNNCGKAVQGSHDC